MISIVIPVLNEQKALPATLAALAGQRAPHEIIVVDGGSQDATCEIARADARVRLLAATKGRAHQMNAGARTARGECLLFLHADTLLPAGALARLHALCVEGDCEAGAFRHRFSGERWSLRFVSALDNARCRATGIFYGDQALFVRRALFWRLGGFPEQPMLEDVVFSERLKRATKPVLLDEHVLTDSRKFVQRGVLRSTARAAAILLCHRLGLPLAGRSFFDEVR